MYIHLRNRICGDNLLICSICRILLKFKIQICRQTLGGTEIDEKLVWKILKFTKYILNTNDSKNMFKKQEHIIS